MSSLPACQLELETSQRPSETRRLTHARHELRTPLNAILGYAEMLVDDFQNAGHDDAAGMLRDMLETGNGILESINLLTAQPTSEPGADRRARRDRAFCEIHAARERIARAVLVLRNRDEIMEMSGSDVEAIDIACGKLRDETLNEEARLRAHERRISEAAPSESGAGLKEFES